MQPGIDVLGLELKTFGLMFALAFVVSGLIVGRGLREAGKPTDWAYEMVFAALVGGLVGARVYWLVQNAGDLEGGVVSNIFSGSGLVWYGGALGGAAGVLAWAAWREMLGLRLLDICAPALALGYAVGRLGCQLSGDGDYGKAWDGPWAMAYPDGTVPTDTPVHPTPLYETLTMGLVAWVLWRSRTVLRPGLVFALYLVLAGLERFVVEFLRRNDPVALGLTAPQWTALVMMLAGVTWLALAASRGGVRGAPAPA
jgi:phosphatidylglycerol---prolipoprotein diacylglyceryl transferase